MTESQLRQTAVYMPKGVFNFDVTGDSKQLVFDRLLQGTLIISVFISLHLGVLRQQSVTYK